MPLPTYGIEEHASLLLRLLPRGRIWPREAGSVVDQVLHGLVPAYAALLARDNNLLVDAFPSTTFELLPEWEDTLGLPDPCSGEDPTIASRQAHVLARFTYSGGQSIPYFVAFAATLGFTITVTEYAPARYGRPNYGQPRYGKEAASVWRVHAPRILAEPAKYGTHRSGEPYALWQQQTLACELNRIKPAHTVLLFSYS